MKTLQNCVSLLLVGLVLCSAQNDSEVTHPPPETTTTSTTTKTTTTTTTTTPAPTPAPTPDPTTTTTSTSTSTSTSTTTSTTTIAPAPSTTPAPTPEPEVGTWVYTNKTTNQTCVLAQMALQVNVTYVDAANKTANALYNIPKDARVFNGSCSTEHQFIDLAWSTPSGNESHLTAMFHLNTTEHEFTLAGLRFVLIIDAKQFPNAQANQTVTLENNQSLFKTPMDMSYHCSRPQSLNLTSQVGFNSTVTVSKLQFEAFHNKHNGKFSIAKDCDAIDTPDIVPIAVGCALILLIVIVLIAYLAGRRSTRSRGYVSM